MGLGKNDEFVFGQKCPSPNISPSHRQFNNISEAVMLTDSFFFPGWDSLVSVDSHHQNDHQSYDLYRQVQCQPGAGFSKLDQRVSCFQSVSYPDSLDPRGRGMEAGNREGENKEDHQNKAEDRFTESSLHTKRRKKMSTACTVDSSQLDPTQICLQSKEAYAKDWKDISHGTVECPTERNPMKNKSEHNSIANARKAVSKHGKDSSCNEDSSKDGYIHVRARRGQATNSHSLAERVRREKISERMKFLQDLVPGCSKITVKAVMLDEIINYVQSLQRQVEFLSMKLATVSPEMNLDVECILSKDIINSEGSASSLIGPCHGMNAESPHFDGFQPSSLQSNIGVHSTQNSGNLLRASNTKFCSSSQITSVWDNELQSIVQMGFLCNTSPAYLDLSQVRQDGKNEF